MLSFIGETLPYTMEFYIPDGRQVENIENPLQWSLESPSLYSVLVCYNGEYICKRLGLRTASTSDKGEFLIIGVPVKLKGVNRHDSHPDYEYCTAREDMLQDIILMKKHNIIA